MEDVKKESLWQRIRRKYRISLIDDQTWRPVWSIHLSWLGATSVIVTMSLITVVLLSLAIVYTPIRNILPGYSQDMREQLVHSAARIDSLETDLELQQRYLAMIKRVMLGEVSSDSVQPIDSFQVVLRDELLQQKNEATTEFMHQYEQRERDNYQILDIPLATPMPVLYRPVDGVIEQNEWSEGAYRLHLRALDNQNVSAIQQGIVVYANLELDNSYTVIVQHSSYLGIYRHVAKLLRRVGDMVQTGESIALVSAEQPLVFELWQDGKSINPEEVIAF